MLFTMKFSSRALVNLKLVSAAICFAALLPSCNSQPKKPSASVQGFYKALSESKFTDAAKFLETAELQSRVFETNAGKPQSEFWANFQNQVTKGSQFKVLSIDNESIVGETAEVKYKVFFNDASFKEKVSLLIRKNGEWKIIDYIQIDRQLRAYTRRVATSAMADLTLELDFQKTKADCRLGYQSVAAAVELPESGGYIKSCLVEYFPDQSEAKITLESQTGTTFVWAGQEVQVTF
jgi:hypothetical protein